MRAKRRAKHRRKKRTPQQRLPPEHLLAQARQSLDDGNPRKALELLRRVPRQGVDSGEQSLLLYCACVERARELARKGLAREAAAMRDRAGPNRAAIAVRELAEPDLIRYLGCLDRGEVVPVYAEYLGGGPPPAAAERLERLVADRLVLDRCWEPLQCLPADHPLRRDAAPVEPSVEAMDRGDWEGAAGLLAGIPRRSPFAPWRTFCKAMTSFADGDDGGLRRAISLLPEEFPLSGTVAELQRCAGGGERTGPAAVQQALGTDDALVAATAARLRQALHRGDEHQTERHLVGLADVVYPENPLPARIDLLMIAARAWFESPTSHFELAAQTVPEEHFDSITAQAILVFQHADPGTIWDPSAAVAYLADLAVRFPCPADQALARGCVLESLARSGVEAGIDLQLLDPDETRHVTTLLGTPPQDPGLALVDLMLASLAADPQSTSGFHFLLDLLRRYPTADEARLRAILQELAARYPEAPEPWLELATLHYARNAYRRAEEALGEALRRAPYDERILDLQAIGFLKSADQSRKRGRFPLAARDLARAVDLRRPRLEPILRVKRLLLDLVRAGEVQTGDDVEAAAAPLLEPLAPAARLRTLAVTIHDLGENRNVKNVDPRIAAALRHVLARDAGGIARLDPDEALELVADLPADCRILYGSLRVAPVLTEWWRAVLARLDGDRLTACCDTLLACGGRKTVRDELDRRLRGGRATDHDPLLQFYLAVIRYAEREDYGATRLVEVVERVDGAGRRRLREAAKRLAPVVDQPLRQALQQFDFKSLDRLAPSLEKLREMIEDLGGPGVLEQVLGGTGEPEVGADGGLDEPAEEAEPEPSPREFRAALSRAARNGRLDRPGQGLLFEEDETLVILDRLEAMIDSAGLRGTAPELMNETADTVRGDRELVRILDDLATWCTTHARRATLSRELEVLLYTGDDAGGAGKERC